MSLDRPSELSPPVHELDDLVAWFRAREKPAQAWRVGLEHEKVLIHLGSTAPVAYQGPRGVEAVLRRFVLLGFKAVEDDGRIIAAQDGGLTVSIEPGGQLELSGRPFSDLQALAAEVDQHHRTCAMVAAELGLQFLAVGYRPWGTPRTVAWMPKTRYQVMRPFLSRRGLLAEDMMAMTGSGQASFDFGSEADAGEKLRLGLAIQPVVTALFANSPILNGAPWGGLSFRVQVWEQTDPARCGVPRFAFEEGFVEEAYRRYAEWALDVSMVFVRRGHRYLDPGGLTFRAFLRSGFQGERPTLADWEDHLTCLFPDARLKGVVEMRGADACDAGMSKGLAAFWKGLLYDDGARSAAWEEVRRLGLEERRRLMGDAGRLGLAASVPGGGTLRELAGRLLALSAEGLARQQPGAMGQDDERRWLEPLRARAESGRSPAHEALEAFQRGGDQALMARLRCA